MQCFCIIFIYILYNISCKNIYLLDRHLNTTFWEDLTMCNENDQCMFEDLKISLPPVHFLLQD